MVGPVIFDAIKRYLVYLGYEVNFVVNITDVDDKLIKQANQEGTTMQVVAERVTTDYIASLKRLNVTSIDVMPRATQHITHILEMIGGLIEKGYAYPAGGDVYFDISKDEDYGKLCNRDPEQLEAGARVEVSEKKRNPGDFAMWKAAKPGEPQWDSPYGKGRPGWHIECSAMCRELLGETVDIHGGGLDLTFPHHENELAQSESFSGKPFANYWLHNGLMRIKSQAGKIKDHEGKEASEKMSKSLGNEIVVSELLKRHHPETLRFLLLNTHYRSPIEYSEERLIELRKALESFYRFFERYERITKESFYTLTPATSHTATLPTFHDEMWGKEVMRLRSEFLLSMDDDFNTGGAIGILFEFGSALNRYADTQKIDDPNAPATARADLRAAALVLRELSTILGLFAEPIVKASAPNDGMVNDLMQLVIDLRAESRKSKNFAMADLIRKRLTELGITLEDRADGTIWRQ